ncbi:MAG: PEP-CTERM sorting domain-containing protein [Planctomycetota bacterium]
MKFNIARIVLSVVAVALLAQASIAQGTAGSPSTVHVHDPSSNTFWVGGPNDTINGPGPIPIDLDASGGPWRKQFWSSPITGFGGGGIFYETILNVGTEPWTDWHEINAALGSHGAAWGPSSVSGMWIDGVPITYSQSVSGSVLDIDNFSQPVLPGQVLEIEKQFAVTTLNFSPPNTLAYTLLEYPTTIPEPATALLVGTAIIGFVVQRRR